MGDLDPAPSCVLVRERREAHRRQGPVEEGVVERRDGACAGTHVVGVGHKPNQKGIDFYKRVLDGLHERSIEPLVPIYHWDLPQSFEEQGGWRSRETSERFADFAALISEELDGVAGWITLNEQWCSAFVGHLEGRHAPGMNDLSAALQAAHHLLLGHGLAVDRAAQCLPSGAGWDHFSPSDVHAPAPSDAEAARCADRRQTRRTAVFLDPLFKGSSSGRPCHWYGARPDMSALRDDHLKAMWFARLSGRQLLRAGSRRWR